MNILYTNFHMHGGGGHDTYIKTLAKNSCHNIYVACPASSSLYQSLKQDQFPNLIALDYPSKPKELLSIFKSTLQLAKIITARDIDIVHTNGSPDNRIALYARMLCRKKFKIVFTRHNSIPIHGIISKWRWMKCNDAAIFVSQSIYKTIGVPVTVKKIFVVRNGIDTHFWQPCQSTNKSDKIKLVSTAGTAHYKGWQYLINALKLLPEHQRNMFEVTIAGHLPDIELRNRLCDGNWLPEIVTFTGFHANPKEILLNADIGFVLSDAIETISFACREMMAMRLPVIVSDFGGLPENITDSNDGWVVPTGDIQQIARVLEVIADMSANELDKMKENARNKAQKEFSIVKMIEETNRFYEAVSPQVL